MRGKIYLLNKPGMANVLLSNESLALSTWLQYKHMQKQKVSAAFDVLKHPDVQLFDVLKHPDVQNIQAAIFCFYLKVLHLHILFLFSKTKHRISIVLFNSFFKSIVTSFQIHGELNYWPMPSPLCGLGVEKCWLSDAFLSHSAVTQQ